ncbi:hypothetical protein EDB19DRAFT_1912192 [Suillus lakei]|nr:hypothetical protein EDB19DRAFT_1912192 [Suillus lakei]
MSEKADTANRMAKGVTDTAIQTKETAAFTQKRADKDQRAMRGAEEAATNARTRQEAYKQEAAEAEETLRRVEEARLVIERQRFEGIRHECCPSEDFVQMKAEYRHSPGFLHLAVVGSSAPGESSPSVACPTMAPMAGIVEITTTYNVPGAGTQNVPDWKYFDDLGLYIFDCMFVLIDNYFLDSDLAILRPCEQLTDIEAFVVRSKSDQHITNVALERMSPGFNLADGDIFSRFEQLKSEKWKSAENLKSKNLSPWQKVYVVCRDAMLAIWNNSPSSMAIDEAELLNDVTECVLRRLRQDVQNLKMQGVIRISVG